MSRLIAPDYGEQFLFPPAAEDWVPQDHPARFLREFVDQLNLAQLGFVIPAATEGRPPYAPSLLLKIWLYGYFNRIRSTRRLEVACREVLPLIWLCGRLTPDHNSLWRFWRDNKKALRQVFKQSVQLAVHIGAADLALQAVDGTKIQSAASSSSGWNKEEMVKLLALLDQALEETELQVMAENETPSKGATALPAGMAERQALRETLQKGLAQIAADGRGHYHPVEPEARRMKLRGLNRYAYNAQAVVDAKEGIVVACEVTQQENDKGQLVPMIEQAKENVGVRGHDTITLADCGYGKGSEVAEAHQQGLDVLVTPAKGAPGKGNPYITQNFTYDAATHTVTCPRGQQLDHEGQTTKKGMVAQRFRCHCQDCPVRGQCTSDPKGRQVEIWPHTPAVQAMRERLKTPQARELLAQRGQIIESRFAQLKERDGFRRWTVWGLESVRTQWVLLCTALNLRVLYRKWRAGRGGSGPTTALAMLRKIKAQPGKWVGKAWREVSGCWNAACELWLPIHSEMNPGRLLDPRLRLTLQTPRA